MSKNRENVTWQSSDGTWNRGFYDFYSTGSYDDEDYDDEWDVEYTNEFHWVSTGHPSEAAADYAWNGANPGGGSVYEYGEDTKLITEELDDKAAQCYDAVNRDAAYRARLSQYPSYSGKPVGRKMKFLLKDLEKARLEHAYHRINGYSNLPDSRLPLWQARVDKVLESNSPSSVNEMIESNSRMARGLASLIKKSEDRRAQDSRYSYGRDWKTIERRQKAEKELAEEIEAFNQYNLKLTKILKAAEPAQAQAGKESSSKASSTSGQYHVNPETGRPNKCYATKRACPFGGAEAHYADKASARKGYEKSQKSSF